jgi:hypothetical protein
MKRHVAARRRGKKKVRAMQRERMEGDARAVGPGALGLSI